MKTLTLSLLVLFLTACTASPTKTPAPIQETQAQTETQTQSEVTKAPTPAIKNCICVKMWLPVCGKNNQTYGNSCEAECAGVKYTQGACKEKK